MTSRKNRTKSPSMASSSRTEGGVLRGDQDSHSLPSHFSSKTNTDFLRIMAMSKEQLKQQLRKRGLKISGNKVDLVNA